MILCPPKRFPRSNIVVAAADNCFGRELSQTRTQLPVQYQAAFAGPKARRRQYLIGKTDFVFIHAPLPQSRVGFREKYHVQIQSLVSRESVEDRYAVRRDDFRQNQNSPLVV